MSQNENGQIDMDTGEELPAVHEVLSAHQLHSISVFITFFNVSVVLNNFTVSNPFFSIARRPVVDDLPVHDLGHMDVQCPFCQALHWLEEHVSSSRIHHPEFEACFQHGKVKLDALRLPPVALYNLFVNDTQQGREFRKNIVQYNAALAFTSLGVNIDRSVLGRGAPVFRIHGELKHLCGSLLPEPNSDPCYSQLYIYDPHAAYQYRISRNGNLSLNTMAILQRLLHDHNAYSPLYRHAYEILRMYDAPDYTIKLCVLPGNDP